MQKSLLLATVVAISSFHPSSHFVSAESVNKLSTSNFDTFISSTPLSLVEFFAPWCGHCKQLAPKYEAAASELSSNGDIKLGAVDCTEEKDLCSKYGVQGYPTLKIFTKDTTTTPADYKGGRETADIVSYMKKQTQPAFTVIKNEADITTLKNEGDDVTVIGIFDSDTSSDAEAFKSVANTLKNDYTFGIVNDKDTAKTIADHLNTHPNTIVLLKKNEPSETAIYDKTIDVESVNKFIKDEAFPLIGNIGPENYQKYLERNLPLVWYFLDETKDTLNSIVDTAKEVAKEFKGKLSMVKLDGVKWAQHGKHFGINEGELPGIVIEDRTEQKNYVYPYEQGGLLDKLKFGNWLKSFVGKELQPTTKSQEPPADNTGPVKTIVGKTFDDLVINNDKDVLVEFYAPWCGHCKQLAPKYEELGKMFSSDANVVIAQVDATENDTPAKIKGFPTIFFYPSGDKANPMEYSGERTAEAMADFVREHGKAVNKAGNESATKSTGHDDEL